jgi:hypothetical protein
LRSKEKHLPVAAAAKSVSGVLVDSRTNKVTLRMLEDNANSQTTWFRYQNSYTPTSLNLSRDIGPNMRLLNTETLRLKRFDQEPLPAYATLSHRWGDQEIFFHELQSNTGTEKEGYQKIVSFCTKAKSRGFEWCWVDTCGIDKTSSAELSEAINSMYKWYERSAVCFVFLPDVTHQVEPDGSTCFAGFDMSCWFTRGWTLQELIAPSFVEFYTSDWIYIGDNAQKLIKSAISQEFL